MPDFITSNPNTQATDESQPKLTRQQIYDRVRESSKDEYILQEMIRLGFWRSGEEKPTLAEEFVQRCSELKSKIRELSKLDDLYSDPEKALEAMRKERKKAALIKREETRKARNQARFQRALKWSEKQKNHITWLGHNVSHGLGENECDTTRLDSHKMPVLHEAKELAEEMGISVSELRFLAFQKEMSKVSHYQKFTIPKKTGAPRYISAPMPRLKRAQYWILEQILNEVTIHSAAHGFVPKRNIVTNAEPHVGKEVVINMDLKDFFPSISYRRVKGVFRRFGYSEEIATILGLLTTEQDTQVVEMDGDTWHIATGERKLPQGAPSSPAITNVLCNRMDSRLQGMVNSLGFDYTRYADDLTFSGNDPQKVQALLWRVKQIVSDEGFTLHPDKTRVMRRHQKQEVTGVVVNDKISIDRKTLKRFRATLHQIEKDGPEGKVWGAGELFQSMQGYAQFVSMVNTIKGVPLEKKVIDLKRKYGVSTKPGRITALNKKLFREKAAQGEAPRDGWWQSADKPAPKSELTAQQKTEQKKLAKQKSQQRVDGNRNFFAADRDDTDSKDNIHDRRRWQSELGEVSKGDIRKDIDETISEDSEPKSLFSRILYKTIVYAIIVPVLIYTLFKRHPIATTIALLCIIISLYGYKL